MLCPTNLAYYDDTYQKSLNTYVIHLDDDLDQMAVYLDATIFYPFGGGQPSDQGIITSETGKLQVKDVRMIDGVVKHECQIIEGQIEQDQDVHLALDWERRHKNMRVHSAGHIIHDVLTQIADSLMPTRGSHGSKPYLEYQIPESFDQTQIEDLESEVNKIIEQGKKVTTRETDLDELHKIAQFIPPNLPKNKSLRIIQIEGYPAMPDGGTQVKNLKEIGRVEITSMKSKSNNLTLKYRIIDL